MSSPIRYTTVFSLYASVMLKAEDTRTAHVSPGSPQRDSAQLQAFHKLTHARAQSCMFTIDAYPYRVYTACTCARHDDILSLLHYIH